MNVCSLRKKILLITVICILSVNATQIVSANTDTFYGSMSDGYAQSTDGDYETARDSHTADTINSGGGSIYVGQTSGWDIRRGFFYIDTSGLPDDALVYKAHLYFTVSALTGSIGLFPVQSLSNPQDPLVAGDFNRLYYTISAWSQAITGTGEKNIVIHDERELMGTDGLDISKTGTTKIGLFASADKNYNGGTPTDTGFVTIDSANTINKPYLIVEYNEPPATPLITQAPESEYQNNYVAITVMTTDPDGDDVQYKVDWGNGEESGWSSPTGSGEEKTISYNYGSVGTYNIKVKARDAAETSDGTYYSNRENTVWSSASTVTTTQYYIPVEPNPDNFDSEDTDQAITALHATFQDGEEEGTNALHVWWDLSEAAQADPNLRMALSVETIEGETFIDTVKAWEYADSRSPYRIEGWNTQYAEGSGRWNFVLKAAFINPVEGEEDDEGNNHYDLRFILGFPLTMEIQYIGLIILSMVIIVVIWKRKSIFYRFYLKAKDMPSDIELWSRGMGDTKQGRALMKKIQDLRFKKRKHGGESASPTINWFNEKINPAREKARKQKLHAERGIARGIALLPNSQPLIPKPPRWASKEEKDAYEKAVEAQQAEKDALIGTGLIEKIFYPGKRMDRWRKEKEESEKKRKQKEQEKRSNASKKGWKKRKKKDSKDEYREKLALTFNRPQQRSVGQITAARTTTLNKDVEKLEPYLNDIEQKLKETKPKSEQAIELADLANDVFNQLKNTKEELKERSRKRDNQSQKARNIGKSQRKTNEREYKDQNSQTRKASAGTRMRNSHPKENRYGVKLSAIDPEIFENIERTIKKESLDKKQKENFVNSVKKGPGYYKPSDLEGQRIRNLMAQKERIINLINEGLRNNTLYPQDEERLHKLLDKVNKTNEDLHEFINYIEKEVKPNAKDKKGRSLYKRRFKKLTKKKKKSKTSKKKDYYYRTIKTKKGTKRIKCKKPKKSSTTRKKSSRFDVTWW